MFQSLAPHSTFSDQEILLRLRHRIIAVWALAEAVLGGILHGLHLPVTGLVIGSIAICCLALLSHISPKPGSLLKATLVVLTIKAMLSPHAPVGAYVAVLSQGFLAEVFLRGKKYFKLRCLGLGLLTQLQSGIQHLITVTVIFGMDFWHALDQYLNKIAENWGQGHTTFAAYFAIFYLALHALMGVITGWVAARLPAWLPATNGQIKPLIQDLPILPVSVLAPKSHKSGYLKITPGLAIIWLVLVAIFLQVYLGIGPEILPEGKVLRLLIRSVLVILLWYFLVAPLLLKFFQRWLSRKKGPLQTELKAVLELLPETGAILKHIWQLHAQKTGIERLKYFIRDSLRQLFALPVNSGK